jgi:ribosomal protein S18 acetylase RimI-like enzyme
MVHILPVSPADWQTWRTLRLAALYDSPQAFGSKLADWHEAHEQRWRDRLSIPGIHLVAHEDAAACFGGGPEQQATAISEAPPSSLQASLGMASGVPADDSDGQAVEVISMWVHPDNRGRGTATALLDAIAAWARSNGYARCKLSVRPDNLQAIRVYERGGFVRSTDELGEQVPGREGNVREVIMVKELLRT